jgi:tRNA-specific 2-thiouridylase
VKALIAMSGGVDSSVAALLTMRAGYECVGVTMKLFANEDAGESPDRPCCSLSGAADAARVCAGLGIPHYVFDFTEEFRRDVIERFVSSYETGETPNPCIDCNEFLKFGKLLDRALQMGFDKVVTGHYAAIQAPDAPENGSGRYRLKRAADQAKDQTYFLYSMTQHQLAHVDFPLGTLTKPAVRSIASEAGFVTAHKAESQDICFVTKGGYADFIEGYRGKASTPGYFVDADGQRLGKHHGITHYTVGQRKKLGIALGRPVFVKEIRPETNEVVLTEEAEVFTDHIAVAHGGEFRLAGPVRADVAIRYGAAPTPASVYPARDAQATQAAQAAPDASDAPDAADQTRSDVVFDAPVRAPAKGQAAVFYQGDIVLGGGRIDG